MGKHSMTMIVYHIAWDDPIMTEDGEEFAHYVEHVGEGYGVKVGDGDMNHAEGAEVVVYGTPANVGAYVADLLDTPVRQLHLDDALPPTTYQPKHHR